MLPDGKLYRDRFTGFTGHATARAEFIDGPPTVRLESLGRDGKTVIEWFPEMRLDSYDRAVE
jgi:hypothetical protein